MTRIVIDYETDPDFSYLELDNPDQQYVALCTMLYDNNDKLVGSLSNSVFYEAADDWDTGTFNTVDEIPARCPHLREVATELLREYRSKMKIYTVTIAANVRAYATVEIEAEDEDAACKRAAAIAHALEKGTDVPEMADVIFDADYNTMTDFESLEDLDPCEEE